MEKSLAEQPVLMREEISTVPKKLLSVLVRTIGIRRRIRQWQQKRNAKASVRAKLAALPSSSQKIIYALTPPPTLPNLGDHAQVVAILKWLQQHFPDLPVLELDKNEVILTQDILRDAIAVNDIIFLHSGGNLGDRGIWSETGRRLMIKNFTGNRIISLPQTIYFSDTEQGRKQQEISRQIYAMHPRLTIIGRDEKSGQIAAGLFPKAQILTIPDFVLSLTLEDFGLSSTTAPNGKILACLRRDNESIFSPEQRNSIPALLGKAATLTDTTLNEPIHESQRFNMVKDFLITVLKHEAVVTDRFHGLIFSIIAQKPAIVLPTVDHKLTSAINWFRDINNVAFVQQPQDINDHLLASLTTDTASIPDFNALYFDPLPAQLKLTSIRNPA